MIINGAFASLRCSRGTEMEGLFQMVVMVKVEVPGRTSRRWMLSFLLVWVAFLRLNKRKFLCSLFNDAVCIETIQCWLVRQLKKYTSDILYYLTIRLIKCNFHTYSYVKVFSSFPTIKSSLLCNYVTWFGRNFFCNRSGTTYWRTEFTLKTRIRY
jgi:hypothetical protein